MPQSNAINSKLRLYQIVRSSQDPAATSAVLESRKSHARCRTATCVLDL